MVLSVIEGNLFNLLCFVFQVITSLFDIHPQVKDTAENVDDALRELPDANMVMSPDYQFPLKSFCIQFFSQSFGYLQKPEDLWMNHSKVVHPKPHRRDEAAWKAIQQVLLNTYVVEIMSYFPVFLGNAINLLKIQKVLVQSMTINN